MASLPAAAGPRRFAAVDVGLSAPRPRPLLARGVGVQIRGGGNPKDNEITGKILAGVEVRSGDHPVLRHNKINRNRFTAMLIHNGGGTVEDNDLTGNARGLAAHSERPG